MPTVSGELDVVGRGSMAGSPSYAQQPCPASSNTHLHHARARAAAAAAGAAHRLVPLGGGPGLGAAGGVLHPAVMVHPGLPPPGAALLGFTGGGARAVRDGVAAAARKRSPWIPRQTVQNKCYNCPTLPPSFQVMKPPRLPLRALQLRWSGASRSPSALWNAPPPPCACACSYGGCQWAPREMWYCV